MPTAAYLAQFPTFPKDLPLYDVPKLSYARLKAKRSAESKRLLASASEDGVFLLNLGDCKSGRALVDDVVTAFETGKSFFDGDLETKKEYMGVHRSFGFKPLGFSKVDGKADHTERYSLSTDTLLKGGESLPKVFIDRRQSLIKIHYRLQKIAMMMLALLERQLHVPKSSLQMFHDPTHSSGTVMRFLHNVKQAHKGETRSSMHAHKDYGTITVLFNIMGGLQVLPSGAKDEDANWKWIKPELNHAIIIIGDALVDLTNGDVQSAYHRVVDPPGDQAQAERYSFGYFLRPNDIPEDLARMERKIPVIVDRQG